MLDLTAAHDFLGGLASAPPQGPWPSGAPTAEYLRSPASARAAQLAHQHGLFLFNYEHRVALDLPEDWIPAGSPTLVEAPDWVGGILAEHKYHSFRHELLIGGFHPGHRAKWSTHEFCHELVGFGWKPGASPLWLATAARLAEMVPVLLYYFFDEAFLARCPDHQGGGALYRTLCPACEAVAGMAPGDPDAARRLEEAARFLERELAAVARTRRTGVPAHHQWATLDLCSDGLAYVAAHGPRLQSATWAAYMERFGVAGAGWWEDLDALEARAVAVARALCGAELTPHLPDRTAASGLYMLQDLGWRLFSVRHQTEGECAAELDTLIERLAAAVPSPADAPAALERAALDYIALFEDWELPAPEHVFAVGYDLPLGGHAIEQLTRGVASALPVTAAILGEQLPEQVEAWAPTATWRRGSIGARFAEQVPLPPAVAELARFEAAVGAVRGRDAHAAALGVDGERFRLAASARVCRFEWDVVDLAEGVDLGDYLWDDDFSPVHGDGSPVAKRPTALLIGVDVAGETLILDVSLGIAERLEGKEPLDLDTSELMSLHQLGVLVPVAWRL